MQIITKETANPGILFHKLREVKYHEAITIVAVVFLPAPEVQRYDESSIKWLKGLEDEAVLKKRYEEIMKNWVVTQKVLPREPDHTEMSEKEVGDYIEHYYRTLADDFSYDQEKQLVMLNSELEAEWTRTTTLLDAAFYKYTQAHNKTDNTKITNLLNRIIQLENERMVLALRFKRLINEIKAYAVSSELLSPEQYARIKSLLGGRYGIEGLPSMNSQTVINRLATLRFNVDKNTVLIEVQVPLEKKPLANIWKITSYPVEQKWMKGVSAEIITCGEYILENDKQYQCIGEEEFATCYKTGYAFICPDGFVELKPTKTCEAKLLENTVTDPTSLCVINLQKGIDETILEFVVEKGFEKIFFFNTPYEKEVSLMCGKTKTHQKLANTGIAHTSPKCQLINDVEITKLDSIEPPLLPDFSLELGNYREALHLPECKSIFKKNDFGIFNESFIRCPIITMTHNIKIIIYSCAGGVAILLVVIVIAIIKCFVKKDTNNGKSGVSKKNIKLCDTDEPLNYWASDGYEVPRSPKLMDPYL
ncbi:hypothetical protein TKK_0005773 [Trichogramma kaykai]